MMARLTNQFLIAMPSLKDPNFHQTVSLICEHNEHGALGIVINRPLDLRLGELFEHLHISVAAADVANRPVLAGGPVQVDHGFVLHQPVGHWESTLQVTEDVGLTTSRDILEATATGEGPTKSLVALGYAGWAPGQLEQEIADNAWLTVPNEVEIVFDLPYDSRWQAAAQKLGVDLALISGNAGHA